MSLSCGAVNNTKKARGNIPPFDFSDITVPNTTSNVNGTKIKKEI